MKLRIRDHSLRFRLDQKDVDALRESGQVESTTQFAPGVHLAVRVARCEQVPLLTATLETHLITLWVRDVEALDWMQNAETGLSDEQSGGDVKIDVTLRLLLEKDYPCLQEREGESDEYAFSWPENKGSMPLTC